MTILIRLKCFNWAQAVGQALEKVALNLILSIDDARICMSKGQEPNNLLCIDYMIINTFVANYVVYLS